MSKTYKFAVVNSDKKAAVEMTFYAVEEPVTVIEMLDMFHSFCLGCGVSEESWKDWIYRLSEKYATPRRVGVQMGASSPEIAKE
jgi:hypothetical protein